MKKILLLMVVIVISLATVGAKNTNDRRYRQDNGISAINLNPEFVQKALPQSKVREASMSCVLDANVKDEKSFKSTLVPDGITGTFYCNGISYFGGQVTGEVTITADATDANKIWVTNLVPGGGDLSVFGVVSDDQKTISFEQGQPLYNDGTTYSELSIYGSDEDIVGVFDATTGVITITSDYWGSESAGGWYELFTGIVTYTRSDMMPPSASYRQPEGALFLGLKPDTWSYYYNSCLIASPNSTWTWNNTSDIDSTLAVSYSWDCGDSVTGESIFSFVDSLVMDVETNFYGAPVLTATRDDNGLSAQFVLGSNYSNADYDSYILAGGNGLFLGFDPACDYGMANLDNGLTILQPRQSVYYFGTGTENYWGFKTNSLMVEYDKPQTPLYFEGINIYLAVFDAPANTPFTVRILHTDKFEDGHRKKGTLIASKTIKTEDVTTVLNSAGETYAYTMSFNGFEVVDEDGFVVDQDYLLLDSAFFVEFTGYEVDGVELGIVSEEIAPTDGKSYSCFTEEGNDTIWSWTSARQTMYMNLAHAAYPLIETDADTVISHINGGVYDIEVLPSMAALDIVSESLPDWLTAELVDVEYSSDSWGATLRISVSPMSGNDAERSASIELGSIVSSKTIKVIQDMTVSVSNFDDDKSVWVSKNVNGFGVHYPATMTEVRVYSISGALVNKYTLPATGYYEISKAEIPTGVYILNVAGNGSSEKVKIINR